MHRLVSVMTSFVAIGLNAVADPQTFTEYTHPLGISFALPNDWSAPDLESLWEGAKAESTIKPQLTERERDVLQSTTRIFVIQKVGGPNGGAQISFSVDPIPPLDRLSIAEARSMSWEDRQELLAVLNDVGAQVVNRNVELGIWQSAYYIESRIEDTGSLVCFVQEFQGQIGDGLAPRSLSYNCPAGKISLRFQIMYDYSQHGLYWPTILSVVNSVHID